MTIDKSYTTATTLAAATFTDGQVGRLYKNDADGEVFRLVDTSPTFQHEYSTDQSDYDITYASTITPNCLNGPIQSVTLTGNVTVANPTNPAKGARLILRITQDGTGSRTITFGTLYILAGGAPTESTGAADVDVFYCVYNGTSWDTEMQKDALTS